MAFCRNCGSELRAGEKYCQNCGSPTEPAAVQPVKAKKPLTRRWWFWVIVVLLAFSVFSRVGSRGKVEAPAPTETPTPTAAPTPVPTPTPAPERAAVDESELREEVKEFLDTYEAFMDEYVDFMQRYMKADASEMLSMMGEYTAIMARYAEFVDAVDALDEEELTTAELAYYIEVTSRVSQKLLRLAG